MTHPKNGLTPFFNIFTFLLPLFHRMLCLNDWIQWCQYFYLRRWGLLSCSFFFHPTSHQCGNMSLDYLCMHQQPKLRETLMGPVQKRCAQRHAPSSFLWSVFSKMVLQIASAYIRYLDCVLDAENVRHLVESEQSLMLRICEARSYPKKL